MRRFGGPIELSCTDISAISVEKKVTTQTNLLLLRKIVSANCEDFFASFFALVSLRATQYVIKMEKKNWQKFIN